MVRDGVKNAFDKYNTGPNGNSIDEVVDLLQSSFECCGTDSKEYWYAKDKYKNHLPLSCCRKAVEYSGSCGAKYVPETEVPFNRGCQSALNDFLKLFTGLIAGILIFAATIKTIATLLIIHFLFSLLSTELGYTNS